VAEHYDALVVGSGPNGLAAAITLARAGRRVHIMEAGDAPGGGMRSAELIESGFRHDICSAVHPFGVASPFFDTVDLARHGVRWLHPEICFAQPLDGGSAALAYRDLSVTMERLGDGAARYRQLVGPLVKRWDALRADVLGPLVRVPRHPIAMAHFGARGLPSASLLARYLDHPQAAALLAGTAAHSILPLSQPFTGGVGALFLASAHTTGWPVVEGGSDRLAAALIAELSELGVTIETGRPVSRLSDLAPADHVLFDIDPVQAATIAGDQLPTRFSQRWHKHRFGPGVFKVDYTLDGPVPWADPEVGRAGTVHVGGTFDEVAEAEAAVAKGRHADRPFVLVAQPTACDPTRAPAGKHILWAYCHVPNGSTVDMTAAIEGQIERFAPGFKDVVRGRYRMAPADLEAHNMSYRGGDIAGGSMAGLRTVFRPTVTLHPYRTPNPRFYLCSSSTPPGAGVHGMCGYYAATDLLSRSQGG
jgi:phytoene dehydrogenase-like protein